MSGERCLLPGCVGEPPLCKGANCEAAHPNACSADPAYAEWRCPRHSTEHALRAEQQHADELAAALQELLENCYMCLGFGGVGWSREQCATCGKARAALARHDSRKGAG